MVLEDTGEWLIRRDDSSIDRRGPWPLAAGEVPTSGDFDGDGLADPATFDAATGVWSIHQSSLGGEVVRRTFGGGVGAQPVPADYDGDGRTELAIFTAIGRRWSILLSSGQTVERVVPEMSAGDLPSPADFDGDGRAELAFYRPGTNQWMLVDDRGLIQLFLLI